MRHAVILAGGSGTRLWPQSRRNRPKQFLPLVGGRSPLELSLDRLRALFASEHIWVVLHRDWLPQALEHLGGVPAGNWIGEPEGRDTANALGLAAHVLTQRDPDATMAVFTADHLISPLDAFEAAIRTGLTVAEAEPDALVAFGITPTEPHTGYGYIERGDPVSPGVFAVRRFVEKPLRPQAEEYLRSGGYLWNSGMFAWRAAALLEELDRLLPENADLLRRATAGGWPTSGPSPEARSLFLSLKRISIDYGVMEKAARVRVVPMNARWLDLGSWDAVAATAAPDAAGNTPIGATTTALDARGNVLVGEAGKLIAVMGVEGLVIVQSGDVTLVCPRTQAERVKQLVEAVQREHGARFV